ncbi:MAG: HDOD domain-containing protein [Ectothiorhodospira sp.]
MPAAIRLELLKPLAPIRELSEAGLEQLREQVQATGLRAGSKFSAADDREHLLYLMAGTVNLVCRGTPTSVDSRSTRAHLPLFSERGQGEFAVVETDAVLLRIPKEAFARLLNAERTRGFEVEDTETTAEEAAILQKLYEATTRNRLELPTMPEVAMSIQRLTRDPDAGIDELIQVIQTDPSVAGALIHATNSPVYRSTKRITNIRDAVVRLGFRTTERLAFNLSMKQTFSSGAPAVHQRMIQLWHHSVEVSAIAHVLARHVRGFEPERAQLAGLMHRIGTIPILNHLAREGQEVQPAALEAAIDKLHTLTGLMVMNYWGMDPEMVTVAEYADRWMRDAAPEPDYCDLIIVSQLLKRGESDERRDLPRADQVPAFGKLGLGPLDEDMNLAVLKAAEEEMAIIRQVLHG